MWTSLADWRENRSTKWANISDLSLALLRNDDGPFPINVKRMSDDGVIADNFELDIPQNVTVDPNAKGKLIIYVEFTKLIDLLVEVSALLSWEVSMLIQQRV